MQKTSKLVLLGLLAIVGGCVAPAPTPLLPFSNGRDAVLYRPLEYRIGNTQHVVEVPAGFVTDFASTPRIAWALFPPFGRYQTAAIVHDFLYWDQACSREEADKLFLYAMEESDVDFTTREFLYLAVRKGGQLAWDQNANDKAEGKPKIIPPAHMPIPAKIDWADYRTRLMEKGIKSGTGPIKTPSYCKAELER